MKCSFTASKKRGEHRDSIARDPADIKMKCVYNKYYYVQSCFLCVIFVSVNLQPIDSNLSID